MPTATKKTTSAKKTTKDTSKKTVKKTTAPSVKVTKKDIIKKHAKHEKDTGSAEVQIALLTTRINELTDHLKIHKKDTSSRRGLLAMVGKRRRLLNYIKSKNADLYDKVIKELSLRK